VNIVSPPRAPSGEPSRAFVQVPGVLSGHDFDFLVGSWMVQHRRLKNRLAHREEWEAFSGTSVATALLGGQANIDDNVLDLPAGPYRAVTLRSFDPVSGSWSIWWLDSRHPHQLYTPVVGGFHDGVGTFFADDQFQGKPIRVRFIWSDFTPGSARWQQAFSEDGGVSWETNWIMEFKRAASPG
jgi:hypothetical protein